MNSEPGGLVASGTPSPCGGGYFSIHSMMNVDYCFTFPVLLRAWHDMMLEERTADGEHCTCVRQSQRPRTAETFLGVLACARSVVPFRNRPAWTTEPETP